MGVFNVTTYASATVSEETPLAVNAAWVDGELLRINVTDVNGNISALALNLEDYVQNAENKEFIAVQAVDLMGNVSGVIQIRNPFFDPNIAPAITTTTPPAPPTESAIPDIGSQVGRPLTPDGMGTVVDNVHDRDGIEFFTIGTEDGNVFYLIIDRQRNVDNVYLLNAVTEEDLISLAQAGGREVTPSGANNSESAIPTPESPDTPTQQPLATPDPIEPENDLPATQSRNNSSTLIIVGIAVLVVGGLGYYFKIVKPKQNAVYDDDEDDNFGYDDESDDDYSDDEDGDNK